MGCISLNNTTKILWIPDLGLVKIGVQVYSLTTLNTLDITLCGCATVPTELVFLQLTKILAVVTICFVHDMSPHISEFQLFLIMYESYSRKVVEETIEQFSWRRAAILLEALQIRKSFHEPEPLLNILFSLLARYNFVIMFFIYQSMKDF